MGAKSEKLAKQDDGVNGKCKTIPSPERKKMATVR